MRRAAMIFGAFVVVGSGCSLFSGLDELASEDPTATEAGAPDTGAPDAPASTLDSGVDAPAGADGGPIVDGSVEDGGVDADAGDGATPLQNLHPYPTFESGCTGWGAYRAQLTASSTAHTGSGSCRVCTDGTDAFFTADDNGAIANPPIGAVYVAEAWLRTAPNQTVPPNLGITLRTRNDGPFMEVEKTYMDLPTATATWTKVSTTLSVTKAAESLNVVVGGGSNGNACFLVDDVAVYRTK